MPVAKFKTLDQIVDKEYIDYCNKDTRTKDNDNEILPYIYERAQKYISLPRSEIFTL